jgi:hypothetical protein
MQAKFFLKLEDWWTFDDGRIPRLQGSEPLHVWWVERSDDGKLNVHFPTSLLPSGKCTVILETGLAQTVSR